MRRSLRTSLVVAVLAVAIAPLARAQGSVVVSHDEWLTGPGWFDLFDNRALIDNTLNWFGLTPGDKVLVYSDNGNLVNGTLDSYLQQTRLLQVDYNLFAPAADFSLYDAILVGGNPYLDGGALASYVFGGGHVFVEGGTGVGWSAVEAAYNNVFLNQLGLAFVGFDYNWLSGPLNTSSFASQGPYGQALFTGVNSVWAQDGNSIYELGPVPGVRTQVWTQYDQGIFAAAEVVPEPATILLLGTGLLGVVAFRRRRKQHDA